MSTNRGNQCLSCETMDQSHVLAEPTIKKKLESHPLWNLNEHGQLSRKFDAKNFQLAMDFIQQAGAAAERHGHHPDIHITGYRTVELVLYTHSVGGITIEDFKMVEALDALPVVYSLNWKKAHPDLVAFSSVPQPTASGEGATAQHHVSSASTRESLISGGHHVHSVSSANSDGSHTHAHEFKVHTGHDDLLGHSDISRTAERKERNDEISKIPVSRPVPHDTWVRMANSLRTLKSSGFDVGEAEQYLPMIETYAIHPAMEGEMFNFYKHLLRRLTPEARMTEPGNIVEAALAFVCGYEELKNISYER